MKINQLETNSKMIDVLGIILSEYVDDESDKIVPDVDKIQKMAVIGDMLKQLALVDRNLISAFKKILERFDDSENPLDFSSEENDALVQFLRDVGLRPQLEEIKIFDSEEVKEDSELIMTMLGSHARDIIKTASDDDEKKIGDELNSIVRRLESGKYRLVCTRDD